MVHGVMCRMRTHTDTPQTCISLVLISLLLISQAFPNGHARNKRRHHTRKASSHKNEVMGAGDRLGGNDATSLSDKATHAQQNTNAVVWEDACVRFTR